MSGTLQFGMQLPPEPTKEMLDAAARIVFEEAGTPWADGEGFAEDIVRETQRKCYAAMAKVVVEEYERLHPGLTQAGVRSCVVQSGRDFPLAPTQQDAPEKVKWDGGSTDWVAGARWAHERWLESLGVKR